ncbi:hypothetical protein GO013_16105 [Pseudodesulfovibrio sp. JC047]|uniref:hypothetical protein n=1 Tax=Pseudodesulfovibrio sp. JC047 TaxID=2683199 RepID=UPI0013D369A1|nr:hypothetical protein [Pseudodesulfovibrio sp. JC047]NDV20935.1 hypothetical protein [Pseudodesulfovibrio sp. JC047]
MIFNAMALAGGGWKKLALGLGVVILMAVLVALAAWRGYRAGYAAVDLKRQAEVSAIHASHSQALATAEATARQRLETATAHAHKIERQYLAAKKTIAKQSKELTNQRIAHASQDVDTADGTCRFGPEWVCAYNAALGTGNSCDTLSRTAAGTVGKNGTAQAVDAGILQGGPAVTPEDILAHARDYGQWARATQARCNALIDWAAGLRAKEARP